MPEGNNAIARRPMPEPAVAPQAIRHRFGGPLVAVLVCIACLTPFLDKAFAIDDPLFLWAARQIQQHPTDPYGFDVTWYLSPMRMADVTKNPPLACYVLAVVAALFGWSEMALHLVFLLPAAGVAWGIYRLAEDLCGRPLLATLAAVLTPAFLVSSTNVMCDTMMLCFWVWALVCWRRGRERSGWLVVAAILISLCALTKYFGVSLIPLLLAHTLIARRRLIFSAAVLSIPIVVLVAYQELTRQLYGQGLLLDAVGFSVGMRGEDDSGWLALLIGLAFTGGCLASVLFYLPLLWPRRGLPAIVALAVALLTPVLALPLLAKHGWDWSLLLQAALFLLGGIAVVALALADLWRRWDADAWLLFLWIAGTLLFAFGVNWVINGRSLLPLAPAAGILMARRLDLLRGPTAKMLAWREGWPLVLSAGLALMVTLADFRRANADRSEANAIANVCSGLSGTVWFNGHWGFQYYLQQRDGLPMDQTSLHFRQGDFIVLPSDNYGIEFEPPAEKVHALPPFERGLNIPCCTMNKERGAGFYAHPWGPLPFVLGPVPRLRYRMLRCVTAVDEE